MKDKQTEYNNGFIEIASYETSSLLMRSMSQKEQLAFLIHNKPIINDQIKQLKNKTVTLTEAMVEESGSLSAENPTSDKAQVSAKDLNNSYLLQKKEQEMTIIKNITEAYARHLYGSITENDYNMQRDTLLKDLTICRAEFYLLKARYKSKKYIDWKMAHPDIDVTKITEHGWDSVAAEIYDESYFDGFGISIHKSRRSSSIQENETQDAKARLMAVEDDIRNRRPILPPSDEEKNTIVLSLANRTEIFKKIDELSKMEKYTLESSKEQIPKKI